MTSQEKKRWLQKYRELNIEIGRSDKRINAKLQQIEQLRSLAERMTSTLTGMPQGGGYKSREDIYIKLADLGNETNSQVEEYLGDKRKAKQMQEDIIQAISQLDDPTLRQLLWLRYIDGSVFEQIAVDMGYCIMQIWRLHGKALERLEVME